MKIIAAGGCINKQEYLPLHKHYHYILRDMFLQKNGAYPEIHLETYYNYFDVTDRIKESLSARPDVLILFIRPFPLHPLIKPVVRYKQHHQNIRTILHPAFRKANLARQTGTMTEHLPAATKRYKNTWHRIMAKANLYAGQILGLDKWAMAYISGEILKIKECCLEKGTTLILAGPTRYPAYLPLDSFCRKLNLHIKELSNAQGICHAEISLTHDEHGLSLFEPNGYHLSPAGHAFLAHSIAKHIDLC